ncbi:MAG: class I SAM-dependent methyltransferase [Anaerolineales bacterium]|nr:class I SAM-dependent methyltransferase [Anaerolineales bacterium]
MMEPFLLLHLRFNQQGTQVKLLFWTCVLRQCMRLFYLRRERISKTFMGFQAIIPFTPFPNDYFDIIVTDAFLTRFIKEEKLEIVPEWMRILKTGGIVLTTARVENAKTETVIADKSSQNDYVLAAQEIGRAKGLDVDDIKNRAKTYAKKITSHPFNDLDEIKTLFTGFTVEAGIADNDFVEIVPRKYARIRAKKEGVAV